ncbi:hypothetical protein GCM10009117_14300 [Gangjinia marincola]|uniref:DUF2141 domain-containing protein n=1 Tax=Gangjinia marincola TaxID=578463 RepID=A0ABP3XV93_9FLAO
MKRKIGLVLITLVFSLTVQAQNSVSVEVSKIDSSEGTIMLALYANPDNFLTDKVFKGGKIAAKKGTVTYTFDNVPDGVYAISLYHDENSDGKLNTNMVGIPKEDYAASNNAKGSFGPPKWADAKFEVNRKDVMQKIEL